LTERPYVVLVLQGGGARAAYQAGVYAALQERDVPVDWVVGVSSGALNAAVIAGNPPEAREAELRSLWLGFRSVLDPGLLPAPWSTFGRLAMTGASAFGRRGFYELRPPPLGLAPPGSAAATSLYSLDPLRATLAKHVDFDRLGAGEPAMSVGAVDVEAASLRFFDDRTGPVTVEHVVASASSPPGAPSVRIDDRLYWDGGIVAETPLQHVLDTCLRRQRGRRVVVLLVDLGSQSRRAPRTFLDAVGRRGEIDYAGRMQAALQLFFSRAWSGTADPLRAPDGTSAGEGPPTAPVGVVHLVASEDPELSVWGPYDFTASALERRLEEGREQTLQALAASAIDFDLFGRDDEPDLFTHLVRDGELVESRRRPLPAGAAAAPTEPADAISLTMPALTDADVGDAERDAEETSSWTSIRAIRLEQAGDESAS